MNDNIIKGEHKIARKLREWYPGAIYHLMHRGVRRTEIFLDKNRLSGVFRDIKGGIR